MVGGHAFLIRDSIPDSDMVIIKMITPVNYRFSDSFSVGSILALISFVMLTVG